MSDKKPLGWELETPWQRRDKLVRFYPKHTDSHAYTIELDIDEAGDEVDEVVKDLVERLS